MGENKKDDILEKEFDFSKAIKNPYVRNNTDKDFEDMVEEYDIDKLNPRKNPYAKR